MKCISSSILPGRISLYTAFRWKCNRIWRIPATTTRTGLLHLDKSKMGCSGYLIAFKSSWCAAYSSNPQVLKQSKPQHMTCNRPTTGLISSLHTNTIPMWHNLSNCGYLVKDQLQNTQKCKMNIFWPCQRPCKFFIRENFMAVDWPFLLAGDSSWYLAEHYRRPRT